MENDAARSRLVESGADGQVKIGIFVAITGLLSGLGGELSQFTLKLYWLYRGCCSM